VRAVFQNGHDHGKKNWQLSTMRAFFILDMGWFGICIENKKYSMDHAYRQCIDACQQCAAACDHCASACLKEENVNDMVKCVQLDMECAVMCRTAAQLMSLESEHANAICQLCADICNACAAECGKHDMDHCRRCAEACHACAQECAIMAAA